MKTVPRSSSKGNKEGVICRLYYFSMSKTLFGMVRGLLHQTPLVVVGEVSITYCDQIAKSIVFL